MPFRLILDLLESLKGFRHLDFRANLNLLPGQRSPRVKLRIPAIWYIIVIYRDNPPRPQPAAKQTCPTAQQNLFD